MKKKYLNIVLACTMLWLMSGCDMAKMLQSAYNLKNCEYKYHSISNLTVSKMNLSNGISAVNAIQLMAALSGLSSSLPLDFTLNLDVHNPHESTAAFSAMDYIIKIDDIEFTNGSMMKPFSVGSGETQMLPISIGFDIAKLAKEHSKDAIVGIVKNFIGLGSEESKVSVQLKPSFNIGGKTVQSPVYIPVNFSFGGKK